MKIFGPINQASERMRSNHPLPSLKSRKNAASKQILKTFLVLVLIGGVSGGVLLAANQAGWTPSVLVATLFPGESNAKLFNKSANLSQEQARERYRAALQLLKKDKDYASALEQFTAIETVYPGLLDLIYLHEAEALTGLAHEKQVQERLNLLLIHRADSPLRALATYMLGQSYYRASNFGQAQSTFQKLKSQFPQSPYAVGGLYYLGNIAAQSDQSPEALAFWKEYIQKSPEGRFGVEIAKELDSRLSSPTAEESRLIGLGYLNGQEDWRKAIEFLTKAPFEQVWFGLGKATVLSGNPSKGVSLLAKGLPFSENREQSKEAIDLIIKKGAASVKTLQAIYPAMKNKNAPGGDYVLWRLSQLDNEHAAQYYSELVKNFSKSDYAPESSWNLIWPLLRDGKHDAFLAAASKHLGRYPYSKSASKTLFWQAKVYEKTNHSDKAVALYHEVLKKHPNTYYAFRSYGRLINLRHHQPDPGWRTNGHEKHYPPSEKSLTLSVIPEQHEQSVGEAQAAGKQAQEAKKRFDAAAKELEAMGVADDLALLFKERNGVVPPTIESWQAMLNGDSSLAIRTIRDAIDENLKTGTQPNADELKLLYPIYFPNPIAQQSGRNNLDPYLVQSLMREESYFNELAVSGSNARGLMQLMPATAQEVANTTKLGSLRLMDLFSPDINIQLGTYYLGYLHRIFGGDSMRAVGSYNGGPNAMKRWVAGSTLFADDPDLFVENIPYEQTRDYIKKVYASFWNYSRLYNPESVR